MTYYIPTGSRFRPYVGAFYRYTYFSNNVESYNSAGGRAGLAITFTNGYVGFGWAEEYRFDTTPFDKTSGHPEVIVGFSF